jgi:hypothetical protein
VTTRKPGDRLWCGYVADGQGVARVARSRAGRLSEEVILPLTKTTDFDERPILTDVSPDGGKALLNAPQIEDVPGRGGVVRWVPYLINLSEIGRAEGRRQRLSKLPLSDPRLVWSSDGIRCVLSSPEGAWLLDRDGRHLGRIGMGFTDFLWNPRGSDLLCCRTYGEGGHPLPPDGIEYWHVPVGRPAPARISAAEAARRFGPSYPEALRVWQGYGQTGATILPAAGGDPVLVSGIFLKRSSSLPVGEISDQDRMLHVLVTGGKAVRREIRPGEYVRCVGWGAGNRSLVGQWGLEGYGRAEDDPRCGDIVRTGTDGRGATTLYRPGADARLIWFKEAPSP